MIDEIPYSEMLYQMGKLDENGLPVPFSFTCATSTGRFLTMTRAVKSVLDKDIETVKAMMNKGIAQAGRERVKFDRSMIDHNRPAKKMWLDIKDLDTGEIKRIYPRTITYFNGYKLSFDV